MAIAVGCPVDCVAGETFERLTVAAGFGFFAKNVPREALQLLERKPLWGSKRTLLLLSTRRADIQIAETVAAFREARQNAEVIVWADEAHWSGELAIECLVAGARDFLVRGIHDGILPHQIGLAKHGRPAYPPYSRVAPDGTKRPLKIGKGRVFVAMPYGAPAYKDWHCGILPALEALGMSPFISTDERGTGPLSAAVKRQIRESKLVIANITRYGRPHNPNVAMELGMARKSLIVRQVKDKGDFSDIAGDLSMRYHHCSDLTVQLYLGFRGCIIDEPFRKKTE